MFDALYGERQLRLVLARHEQGAVHAADGYARSTGRVGVCLVTSGPGATNTVTGLATANYDSVPLVVLTGQVSRNMIGNDAFQEADIVGHLPVGHEAQLPRHAAEGPRAGSFGRRSSSPGAAGPARCSSTFPRTSSPRNPRSRCPRRCPSAGYNPVYKGHPLQIRKAAQALAKAKKPLFYVGGGLNISGAAARRSGP